MSIDQKTARHICNVTRRQIQNAFPELHLHFCVHGENKRKETLTREIKALKEHPASKHLLEYHDTQAIDKIMQKNKTRFISMARHNKPGFLGFFRNNAYLALCVVNYERFSNEENLRNHIYLIVWHALSLYHDFLSKNKNKGNTNKITFIDDHNVLIPNLSMDELAFRNLSGDIFSACIQILLKRKNVIESISKQRITDTMTPHKGFRSEMFPFPVCADQLEAIMRNIKDNGTKNKRTVQSAIRMTNEISQTYDETIIERWKSFSLPAQQMAWAGQTPETILGAALYTCENTYTQSTADMVAEETKIKPEPITSFHDHNPFTKDEANEQTHANLTQKTLETALNKIKTTSDHKILFEIANKQNELLRQGKAIGWCAGGLLRAVEMIKHCKDPSLLQSIIEQAKEVFTSECKSIEWDTLNHFAFCIFQERRKGRELSQEDLIQLSAKDDEFATIHNVLYALKLEKEEKIPDQISTKVNLEQQDKDFTALKKAP